MRTRVIGPDGKEKFVWLPDLNELPKPEETVVVHTDEVEVPDARFVTPIATVNKKPGEPPDIAFTRPVNDTAGIPKGTTEALDKDKKEDEKYQP